jgi:hypothetical protein
MLKLYALKMTDAGNVIEGVGIVSSCVTLIVKMNWLTHMIVVKVFFIC